MRLNTLKYLFGFSLFIYFWMGVNSTALRAQASFPDRLRFDSYTINEGLTESVVRAIAEDKYGEMCIGTEKGMDIFNGYDFVNSNISNKYDLSEITSITALPNDYLFVHTLRQKSFFFDPSNRTCIPADSLMKQLGFSIPHKLYCVLVADNGNIWYGSDSGVLNVDFLHSGIGGLPKTSFYPIPGSAAITSLAEDGTRRIWAISGGDNILILDGRKGGLLYRTDAAFMNGGYQNYLVLYSGKDGSMWVGSERGAYVFNGIREGVPSFRKITLLYAGKDYSNSPVNCFYMDAAGKLWLGTSDEGVFLYNCHTRRIIYHFIKSTVYPKSLNSNLVFCITQDSHQRIWIGTSGGVNKYDANAHKFSLYDYDPVDPNKTLSMVFGMIKADSQHLMVVSNDHPCLINTCTGKITPIHSRYPGRTKEIYKMLFHGGRDTIWAPSILGLRVILKRHGQYEIDKPNIPILQPIDNMPISAILREGDSLIWFGLSKGLYLWNRKLQTLSHIIPAAAKPQKQYDHYIKNLVKGDHSDYWMGTENGIICYDRSTDSVTHFLVSKAGDNTSPLYVNCLIRDKEVLWIATLDKGLFRFNTKTHTYKQFTTADGLPDNTIWACAEDKQHHIWMSTGKGICEFFPPQNQYRYFTREDGLQSDEFNQGSVLKTGNGDIFFGGIYGINRISPGNISLDTSSIPVVISKMEVYTQDQSQTIFPGDRHHFTFSYKENTIVVQFNALNYIQPKLNHYRYKLIKADFPERNDRRQNAAGWSSFSFRQFMENTWIEAGNTNSVTFSQIAPGDYILAVEAMNASNVWSKQPGRLFITILPPFWQTGWFRIAVAMLFLILLGVAFRRRLKAVEKRNRQKIEKSELTQKVMQLEKMALQAQMNPHFIFNSLNSVKAYILSSDSEQAIDYLNDFASLIRKVLQNSKRETIPLSEELEAIERYIKLEERRLKKKLWLNIRREKDLSLSEVLVPPLIIQPLVENAIWHGIRSMPGEGVIDIMIKKTGRFLVVTITDNGIGRKLAAQYRNTNYNLQSMGTSITEERLWHFNRSKTESLVYEDLPDNAGTRVKLCIHLDNDE